MLQRQKSTKINGKPIVDLPQKTIVMHAAEFNDLEERIYAYLNTMAAAELNEYSGEMGQFLSLWTAILRMRQTCCDVQLLLGTDVAESFNNHAAFKAEEFKVPVLPRELTSTLSSPKAKIPGPKIRVLVNLLGTVRSKEPDARFLHRLHKDYKLFLYEGSLDTGDRQEAVQAFQNGKYDGMLLILGAGGQGLTLTCAQHVFILTPSWNPGKEAQAEDRAYRIGQTKPVVVYRIILRERRTLIKGTQLKSTTVEDYILAKQQMKRSWAAGAAGTASMGNETKRSIGLTLTDFRAILESAGPSEKEKRMDFDDDEAAGPYMDEDEEFFGDSDEY
ncbi:MAG: hypothetical protein Q9187_008178 [Circinaria calcarea]